jgi:hypothetical protein
MTLQVDVDVLGSLRAWLLAGTREGLCHGAAPHCTEQYSTVVSGLG